MANKIGFLVVVLWSAVAVAQNSRIDFRVDAKGGPDLLRESERLQLISEPGVQPGARPRQRTIALGLGQTGGEYVNVKTDWRSVNYELSEPIVMLRFSYLQLPWEAFGQWGWQLGAAYGWRETKTGSQRTMLHLLPVDLALTYRGRLKSSQLIAPQLGVGGGSMMYFQRGGRGLNTSESTLYGAASAGLWLGVGEWWVPESLTPLDLTLTYHRIFSRAEADADWRGDWWFVNLGVSL